VLLPVGFQPRFRIVHSRARGGAAVNLKQVTYERGVVQVCYILPSELCSGPVRHLVIKKIDLDVEVSVVLAALLRKGLQVLEPIILPHE